MFKKTLVVLFVMIWVVLAFNPVNPGIWALENVLVVTIFPLVLWLDKQYHFTNATFLSLTIFVILHLFGAHMTYENMAYFSWFSDLFGWQRNYYDQLIHFLFGLMVFSSFFEIFYHQGISRRLSYLIAFLFITSIGAAYEVLEWLSMRLFCTLPDELCFAAITQRDLWDTQKDIAYAMIGSIVALLLHRQWSQPSNPFQNKRQK